MFPSSFTILKRHIVFWCDPHEEKVQPASNKSPISSSYGDNFFFLKCYITFFRSSKFVWIPLACNYIHKHLGKLGWSLYQSGHIYTFQTW